MQISHVRMHAIIKERYIFPKKRNVLVSGIGKLEPRIGRRESGVGNRVSETGIGSRESGIQSYSVWNCPSAT